MLGAGWEGGRQTTAIGERTSGRRKFRASRMKGNSLDGDSRIEDTTKHLSFGSRETCGLLHLCLERPRIPSSSSSKPQSRQSSSDPHLRQPWRCQLTPEAPPWKHYLPCIALISCLPRDEYSSCQMPGPQSPGRILPRGEMRTKRLRENEVGY